MVIQANLHKYAPHTSKQPVVAAFLILILTRDGWAILEGRIFRVPPQIAYM